jgi:two-component system nitrate/nitrite response regulator NarL
MSQEREVQIPRDTPPVTIMVVSDVRLYRDGLAASLAERNGLEVVCTAHYADEAERLDGCRADILVLDVSARQSIDVIRRVASSGSGTRTVAFAVEDTERDLLLCAEAGAAGFVAPDGTLDDLVNTIRGVSRGELLDAPRTAARALQQGDFLAPRRSERTV